MRIQQNPAQQNFGAIPVTKTIIKRKVPFTPFYKKAEATFVKLDRDIGRKLLKELVKVLNSSEADAIELKPIPIKRKAFYEKLGFKPLDSFDDIFEVPRRDFDDFIARN